MSQLVQRKESKRYPGLFVKKYAKRVFWDNLWHTDTALIESRGHVEDANGNVVINPLTKIFNYQENDTTIDRDEQCVYVRKVNGFMAAVTYVPLLDEVVVSTTGSTDSDFVAYAEQYITPFVKQKIKRLYDISKTACTYVFEIVHPVDPHIIVEDEGAYLLGVRLVSDSQPYFSTSESETNLDTLANVFGVRRPEWHVGQFSDIVRQSREVRHEGFVVYGQQSKTVLKIKSPYYLTLKLCARKKDVMSLNKQQVDEEFYPLIDFIKQLGEEFVMMDEQTRLDTMVTYLRNVK